MTEQMTLYTDIDSGAGVPFVFDQVLLGANGGVFGLFDTDYALCFGGATGSVSDPGVQPTMDQPIFDISELDFSVDPVSGTAISQDVASAGRITANNESNLPAYSDRMIDFSTVAVRNSVVRLPEAVTARIAGLTNQHWMQVLYVRLPERDDWNTSAVRPFSCFSTALAGFTGDADLLTICQAALSGNPRLRAFRMTTGPATGVQVQLMPVAEAYGAVCQIAWWRDAEGEHLSLRSPSTRQTVVAELGAPTSVDLTGKYPQIGITNSFWGNPPGPAGDFAIARGWFEDLDMSGRAPLEILEADWLRTVARGAFS